MQSLPSNAENRKWDFTNWSQATVTNLKAGADWSDIEKANGTEPTELSKDNCFWEVGAAGTADGTSLTANGEVIAELDGLLYTNTTARSLAIAVNYGDVSSLNGAGFGPYHGASYLWFGGSKKNYFVIPHVKAGAKIKMGVESHKLTDARGVNLYVGHGTGGTQLKSPSGETVSAPKEYTDQEWMVPTELGDTPNEDGTFDIQIYNTNGCHIYYIEVLEDAPAVENAKIAYVFDSTFEGYSSEEDVMYTMISDNDDFKNVQIEKIDVSGDISSVSRDVLLSYDVVVVSSTVSENNAIAATLKSVIAYVPMLNFNAKLYKTWGYGEMVNMGTNVVDVPVDARNHDLFKSKSADNNYVTEDGKLALFASESINGVVIPEGSYFSNDNILAATDKATAIHIHNQERNAYIFIPYVYETPDYPDNNLVYDLPINAVTLLNYSKSEIPQAASPTFKEDYGDMNTNVSVCCGTKGAVIYYTTDGSVPTEASNLYTGPVNITAQGTVIKAVAYADGYTPSEVAEFAVGIYTTTAAPVISVEQQDGKSVVTLSTTEEGASIYYNITGSNKTEASSVYSEPIEVESYVTITAFTGELGDKKQSETVSQSIFIQGKEVRIDVVSHLDANKTDWAPGGANPTNYNGKNGHAYYSDITIGEPTIDPDTQEEVYTYEPANNVVYVNPGKGWEVRTEAQAMLWQNNGCTHKVGDGTGYNPETALDDDVNATGSCLSFGSSSTTNAAGTKNPSYTGSIQSTEAFQGPFDIVTNIANTAKNGGDVTAKAYVTADTLSGEWIELGDLKTSTTGRLWKHTVLGYEGTDKVFVKICASGSVGVFDIFIKNNGEKSQEVNGIREITSDKENNGEVVRTMIYSINGTQLDRTAKGINIVKEIYSDGTVRTKKVMMK